jgi:hypothetical protein
MSWLKKYEDGGSIGGDPVKGYNSTTNPVPKKINPDILRPSHFENENEYIKYFTSGKGSGYKCGKNDCADFANNYAGFVVGLDGIDRERWEREGNSILSGHAWQNYGYAKKTGGKSKFNSYLGEGDLKNLKEGDIVGLQHTKRTVHSGNYNIDGENAPLEGVENSHTGVVDFVDSKGNVYVKHNVSGEVRFTKINHDFKEPTVDGWKVVTAVEPNWGRYSPEFKYDDNTNSWKYSKHKSDYNPDNVIGLQSMFEDVYDETIPGNLSTNPITRSNQLKDYNWEKPSRNKRTLKIANEKMNNAVTSLNTNKEALMDYYRLSEDEFNELAKNSIAATGVESKFGNSWKEEFKSNNPWLTSVGKALNPFRLEWDRSALLGFGRREENEKEAFNENSVGIGQIKPYSINPFFENTFGLNTLKDYKKPEKNILGVFSHMYEDWGKAKKWKDNNKELSDTLKDPMDLAYPVYNTPNTTKSGKLTGQETPDNINYRRFGEYKESVPVVGSISNSTLVDPNKSFLKPVEIVETKRNGGWLNQYEQGGPINPEPAKRQGSITFPGTKDVPNNEPSTHLYASGKSDGKNYAFPTLFQTPEGGWYQHQDPFGHALEIREAIEFKNQRQSRKFAEGSWKKEMEQGGPINGDPVPYKTLQTVEISDERPPWYGYPARGKFNSKEAWYADKGVPNAVRQGQKDFINHPVTKMTAGILGGITGGGLAASYVPASASVAPIVTAAGNAMNAPMLGTPGLTANNLLWGLGAGLSTNEIIDPKSATRTSINKAIEDPTVGNVASATGNSLLTGLGFVGLPYKQGAASLADDVTQLSTKTKNLYNDVATGNSKLTDLGVRAWKVEKPLITPRSSDYVARNYTDEEVALLDKYGFGMQLTPDEWKKMEQLVKSGATDFSKNKTPITRIPLYYNRSEEAIKEAEEIYKLKIGETFKTPVDKNIRTWSAGIPKGVHTESLNQKKPIEKMRLVIPSRYTKNLGNDFAAMPYFDKRVNFIWDSKTGKISSYAVQEKELMGNLPEGFKVIGKSNEGGMNNIIIKPINNKSIPKPNITSSVDDVGKGFKSEIDWGKWNKEIPDNKALMQEYNVIEQQAKSNNTWMKNPDGSTFQGTPEQFVQQNSENFKKAYPEYYGEKLNHNSPNKFNKISNKYFGTTSDRGWYGEGLYTHPEKEYTSIYGDNNYEFYVNSKNKGIINKENYNASKAYQRNYDLEFEKLNKEKQLKLQEIKNNPKEYTDFEFWNKTINNQYDKKLNNLLKEQQEGIKHNINQYTTLTNPQNGEVVIPFNNRVKSAVGNNGMFDMTNPNIYKSILPIGLGLGTASQIEQKQMGGWLNKYN